MRRSPRRAPRNRLGGERIDYVKRFGPLTLVLLWHMHQPDYRDYATGEFREPWVYLHAIKEPVQGTRRQARRGAACAPLVLPLSDD